MRRFFHNVAAWWSWRLDRKARFAIAVALAIIILIMVMSEVSMFPRFCLTCHYMVPYYDNWRTSTHNQVRCVTCHYPPTLDGWFEGKRQAASQLVTYMLNTYKTKPVAEIEDASCLRKGCHDKRLLAGAIQFKPVLFAHRPHLTQLRRGKVLRCTSCHSQIVQGEHITVTETTCFLCHFKGMEAGEAMPGCPSCHGAPEEIGAGRRIGYDHGEVVSRGLPCKQCHYSVTRGDGAVPRQQCLSCHGEMERLAFYDRSVLLHQYHVSDHKIECFECHLDIEHGLPEFAEGGPLNCQSCHPDHHWAERAMYTGSGGSGVEEMPSLMFVGSVTCRACHTVQIGDHLSGRIYQADGAACVYCHGEGYRSLFEDWGTAGRSMLEAALSSVEQAEREVRAAERRGRDVAEAEALLRDARHNVMLGAHGNPIHNLEYARALLSQAGIQLEEALGLVESSYRPHRMASAVAALGSDCLICHAGVEARTVRFFDKAMPHARHVVDGGMECGRCHREGLEPDEVGHGSSLIDRSACQGCHHVRSRADCRLCHSDEIAEPILYERIEFPHMPHIEVGGLYCTACHHRRGAAFPIEDVNCGRCHHREAAECEVCHTVQAEMYRGQYRSHQGVQNPMAVAGIDCSACHWDSEGRAVVRPGADRCVECHGSGYDAVMDGWQQGIGQGLAELEEALGQAESGVEASQSARAILEWVENDGSRGVHNFMLADSLLGVARQLIE